MKEDEHAKAHWVIMRLFIASVFAILFGFWNKDVQLRKPVVHQLLHRTWIDSCLLCGHMIEGWCFFLLRSFCMAGKPKDRQKKPYEVHITGEPRRTTSSLS